MVKKYVMFFLATVLVMLPLTGNTMSYNQGYVEGVEHQQQVTLQKETESLSAFIGESEADLFQDNIGAGSGGISAGGIFGTSSDSNELALSEHNCSGECHSNPEVGWRGSL